MCSAPDGSAGTALAVETSVCCLWLPTWEGMHHTCVEVVVEAQQHPIDKGE